METGKIVLGNRLDEISRLVSFLEEIGQKLDLSVETSFNIHLALEEAITNVIMYAYPKDEEHELELTVYRSENELIFEIKDEGEEFDPTLHPEADTTLSLEDRPVGGLGIFLIRRIMQRVEYRREDGKNILTLVKKMD